MVKTIGIERTVGFKEAALAGQELYEAKMADPVVLARRAKALERITDADWKTPSLTKGVPRIGPGVTAAVDKQARNWSPYRAAIEGVTLPPKTVDPMANIDSRLKPIVAALVAKKREILGE